MPFHTIMLTIAEGIAQITLNRPEALNALNGQLLSELMQALEDCDTDPKARCIILTGSDKAFAAGADITEMAGMTYVEAYLSTRFSSTSDRMGKIRKPIIAAVAGYALGGGCELAMMCDTIICADTAKFGQPEINLGIIAGMGGSQRLTRFVGKAKAMDMNLTGRMMDAAEAERSGLVSRVVPADKLLDEARAMATKIAAKSQIAVMAAKEAVNRSYESTLAEGLLFERRMFQSLFGTEDQKEGMAAFVAKREAKFHDQ